MQLSVGNGRYYDNHNFIGTGGNAHAGMDALDIYEAMKPMGGYVKMYLDGEVDLASDMRSRHSVNYWVVNIESNKSDKNLMFKWNNYKGSAQQLYLIDEENLRIVDMSLADAIKVNFHGQGSKKYIITTEQPGMVLRNMVADNRYIINLPNPFTNGKTLINYRLPVSQLEAQSAKIQIFNHMGKLVDEHSIKEISPLSQSMEWNYSGPGGVYIYRLSTDKGWTSDGSMLLVK